MERRPKRVERQDTEASSEPYVSAPCLACADDDPQIRHTHYLTMARTMDFARIDAHLAAEKSRRLYDRARLREDVQGCMAWIKDQVLRYSGEQAVADPDTGAPLPWWEGRQAIIRQMRRSTDMKRADADRARSSNPSGAMPTLGAILARVPREPGEDASPWTTR